jgi:arylsulfatase A-like enzyme
MKYVLGGAAHGAYAWAAYGVVEQGFCFVLPMLHGLRAVHGASEWGVVAALAGAYVVLGALFGAAAGMFVAVTDGREGTPSADRLRAVAVATLALAFVVDEALVRPFGKADAFSLALGVGAAIVLVKCVRSEGWMTAIGGAANPWVAGLVFLGGAWTGREVLAGTTTTVQLGGAVGAVLLVIGTAVAASRVARRSTSRRDRLLPARGGLAFVGGVMLVSLLGIAAARRPAQEPAAVSVAPAGRPNLILVTLDTVRADHLSLYGYGEQTTPFLAEFARRATVFTNAFATSDQTLTTHASMFTGLYGSWTGAIPTARDFSRGRPLGLAHPTLAQRLADNGYRTTEMVANYAYLGPAFGLERGFRERDVLIPSTLGEGYYLREPLLRWMARLFSWGDLELRCARAGRVNRDVFEFLRVQAPDRSPFFLFVNYLDAHVPYLPPAPFNRLFPGRNSRLGPWDYPRMRAEIMAGRRAITPEERRHFMSQYDGAVRYIDTELRRLVEKLVDLGLYENSIIVICSDHGEAFGEHGLVQHGVSVYQDQIYIPLIIKFPGQHAPRTVTAPVSEVDLLPTILSALGLEVPHGLVGVDLRHSADEPPRTIFSESFYLRGFGSKFDRTERAAVRWPMKLVVSTAGKRELYDLARDPGERHDLFRADDSRAQDLLARLTEWVRAIPPLDKDAPQLDLDTLRRLKALGYVN